MKNNFLIWLAILGLFFFAIHVNNQLKEVGDLADDAYYYADDAYYLAEEANDAANEALDKTEDLENELW